MRYLAAAIVFYVRALYAYLPFVAARFLIDAGHRLDNRRGGAR